MRPDLAIASGTRIMLRREKWADRPWKQMFRLEAWIEQGRKCFYCHEPMKRDEATADHVEARINGGATSRRNIKAACLCCNKTKGHLSASAFLAKIKNPQPGDDLNIWLAWSRRRIWLAVERACKRIERVMT